MAASHQEVPVQPEQGGHSSGSRSAPLQRKAMGCEWRGSRGGRVLAGRQAQNSSKQSGNLTSRCFDRFLTAVHQKKKCSESLFLMILRSVNPICFPHTWSPQGPTMNFVPGQSPLGARLCLPSPPPTACPSTGAGLRHGGPISARRGRWASPGPRHVRRRLETSANGVISLGFRTHGVKALSFPLSPRAWRSV